MQDKRFLVGVALIGVALVDAAFDPLPHASTVEFLTAGVALILGTKAT